MNTQAYTISTLMNVTATGHLFCVRVEKNWETCLE